MEVLIATPQSNAGKTLNKNVNRWWPLILLKNALHFPGGNYMFGKMSFVYVEAIVMVLLLQQ